MGEPLSPDRVFIFPIDEPEPHPAYDFLAPGPLPGYAGNPNNNNGWIKEDVPSLKELGVIALVVDVDEDIAMQFGDDDFEDDDSEEFDEEDVWEVNEEWLMALVTPPPMSMVPPSSVYEVGGPSIAAVNGSSLPHPASGLLVPPSVIEDLSTRLGNLEYRHGQLMKKVIQVSDTEVAAGVTIGEIGPKVFAVEGQVQVMESQMVHAANRFELIGARWSRVGRLGPRETSYEIMIILDYEFCVIVDVDVLKGLVNPKCGMIPVGGSSARVWLGAVDVLDGTERGYQGRCLGEVVS
ncbi:hypothetical protein Tco_0941250 [Tanacetum coccineum]|uniref:Uncharacterized protein n=1 Tax=Tanacetum coccineum TaxID=301880 RepID=A0ABQ5DQB5_9ASTR